MFQWLAENAGTIIAAAVVLTVAGAAAASLIVSRRKGKSMCSACGGGCGCSCSGCPMSGKCHAGKSG